MINQLTTGEHDAALSTGTAVLVFLWADSPASQKFQPELERLARRRTDVPFYVVDPMVEEELAEVHHLRALPTIIVYRDGLPLRRVAGSIEEQALDDLVNEVLEADMEEERADWFMELVEADGEFLSPALRAS
jgi:thioredoxin 1